MITLKEMQSKIDEIEPWLTRTSWPPMSYMLIPGVMKRADDYLNRMRPLTFESIEWEFLYQRLYKLRHSFKRLA